MLISCVWLWAGYMRFEIIGTISLDEIAGNGQTQGGGAGPAGKEENLRVDRKDNFKLEAR